ncbi:hypothetical protein LINPERPRIM_LOCUS33152 [Linum perenne]
MEIAYRCTSYSLLGTRGLHPHTAGVMRFSHGCIRSWGGRPFFSAGSMRGTGDIGGFTLLVKLWALERFPRIAERYIQSGAPPRG